MAKNTKTKNHSEKEKARLRHHIQVGFAYYLSELGKRSGVIIAIMAFLGAVVGSLFSVHYAYFVKNWCCNLHFFASSFYSFILGIALGVLIMFFFLYSRTANSRRKSVSVNEDKLEEME